MPKSSLTTKIVRQPDVLVFLVLGKVTKVDEISYSLALFVGRHIAKPNVDSRLINKSIRKKLSNDFCLAILKIAKQNSFLFSLLQMLIEIKKLNLALLAMLLPNCLFYVGLISALYQPNKQYNNVHPNYPRCHYYRLC